MPIMPQYRSPYGQSIMELLAGQGEAAARAAERRSLIWGNAVANLGQIGAQAYEQHQQQKDQQQREALFDEAVATFDPANPQDFYRRAAVAVGPEKAIMAMRAFAAVEESKKKGAPDPKLFQPKAEFIAERWKSNPAWVRENWGNIYTAAGEEANALYGTGFTPQWDEKYGEVIGSFAKQATDQKLIPVAPNTTLFDPAKGEGVFTAPAAPKDEKKYQVTVRGEDGRPVTRLATETELAGGIEEYQKPLVGHQPSYQAKEVLNDEGKPVMANFNAKTGQYVEVSTGKPIQKPKPVPSAAETQDSRKFQQAGPVLAAVSELSERINTLKGVYAKAQGEAAKAAAKVNLNDDVAEYEALVSGFTPLVARALGHTGVLTQQDVDSVRNLFPTPGDSKTLRDRKVKRMNGIIKVLQGGAPEETTGGSAGPKMGERRKFAGGKIGVWDGKGWAVEK